MTPTAPGMRQEPAAGWPPVRGGLVAALGTASLGAQLLLAREWLVLGGGDELPLLLGLVAWLAWTGLGGALAAAPATVWTPARRQAAWGGGGPLLALLIPGTLLLFRAAPGWLGGQAGEMPGLWAAVLLLAGGAAPLCLLNGLLLGLAAAGGGSAAALRVYGWDAAGSLAGGVAGSVALWLGVPSLTVAVLLAALLLAAAVNGVARGGAAAWPWRVLAGALFGAMLAAAGGGWSGRGNTASLAWGWPGYRVTAAAESEQGRAVILEREGERTPAYDGRLLAAAGDGDAAALAVHPALWLHPAPRRVLLVGVEGMVLLPEVLRHPGVRRVEVVQPDRELARLLARQFDARLTAAWLDGRVQAAAVADPVAWLRRPPAPDYDVILLPAAPPTGVGAARLFAGETLVRLRARLRPGGVLVLSLPWTEAYSRPEGAAALQGVVAPLAAAFPADAIAVLPLADLTLAAFHAGPAAAAAALERLPALAAQRPLPAPAVAPAVLAERLRPERVSEARHRLAAALSAAAPLPPHRLWLAGQAYRLAENGQSGLATAWLATLAVLGSRSAGVPAAVLAALLLGWGAARGPRAHARITVWTAGVAGMAGQTLVLLGYQAVRGRLFWGCGVLMAGFMAGFWLGLRGGGWLAARRSRLALALAHGAALAGFATLAVAWGGGGDWLAACGGLSGWTAAAVSAGLLSGGLFAAGVGPARCGAGWLFGLDLWGAATGAGLGMALFLPLGGLAGLAAAGAVLHAVLLAAGWRPVVRTGLPG